MPWKKKLKFAPMLSRRTMQDTVWFAAILIKLFSFEVSDTSWALWEKKVIYIVFVIGLYFTHFIFIIFPTELENEKLELELELENEVNVIFLCTWVKGPDAVDQRRYLTNPSYSQ